MRAFSRRFSSGEQHLGQRQSLTRCALPGSGLNEKIGTAEMERAGGFELCIKSRGSKESVKPASVQSR